VKKSIYLVVIVIIVIGGGFFFIKLLLKNHKSQNGGNTAQLTPPPTLPLANTTMNMIGTKIISFPAFHISFQVPNNLKTNKKLDPTSEDTQIGSSFIALYSPDSIIDTRKHKQTAGAKLSINIVNTKKDFTDEKDIIPTTSMKEDTTDTSVIPTNNALLNSKDMKVHSFPSGKPVRAWAYNAEALLKNGGSMLDVVFYCVDYSDSKQSPTCQKLLKEILPTLQH